MLSTDFLKLDPQSDLKDNPVHTYPYQKVDFLIGPILEVFDYL